MSERPTYWSDWERVPRTLREQYGTRQTKEAAPASIRISQLVFELPIINFQTMYYWAETDGTVRDISNYVADQALANGISISYDPKYPKGEEARDMVLDFFHDVDMEEKAWNIIKWGYLTGNVFAKDKTNFIQENKFEILPIDSVLAITRKQDQETGYTKLQKLWQTFEYQGRVVEAERLFHYLYGLDNTSGLGRGVLQSLLSSRQVTLSDPKNRNIKSTIQVPPLMYVMSMLIYDINQAYHSYAEPKRLVSLKPPLAYSKDATLPNATNVAIPTSELQNFQANWSQPGDSVVNYEAEIINATISSGLRWATELSFLENRFVETFGMPYTKLFTTPGFTEASARVAKEVADRRVYSMQRWFGGYTESNVIEPLLEYNEFSVKKAKMRINFGSLDRSPTKIADILQAAGIGNSNQQAVPLLSPAEARTLLRQMAGWSELDSRLDAQFDAEQKARTDLMMKAMAQPAQPTGAADKAAPKKTKVTDAKTGESFVIQTIT